MAIFTSKLLVITIHYQRVAQVDPRFIVSNLAKLCKTRAPLALGLSIRTIALASEVLGRCQHGKPTTSWASFKAKAMGF